MRLPDFLLGRPLSSHEEEEQKVGVAAGIPLLGLDALSSAAYGPEAAMTLLLPLGAAGIGYIGPISTIIIVILVIVYASYLQTIGAYPGGGGSFTVARRNLGVFPGLLAGAALLLDYVLVVAVGISAGVGALVSAIPRLQPHTLALCLAILAFITVVNLRGIRESGVAFALPTYAFVLCLFAVLTIGVAKTWLSGGNPTPVVPPPAIPAATTVAGIWLLVRAFASGCTAMTGIEAVSNGVPVFAQPAVRNARRTLTAIVAILVVLLAGIAYLSHTYRIAATEPGVAGYQSVLSQLVAAVVGRGVFYYICIAAILSVLALSANTGFADFPRLCRLIAENGFLPRIFASRGRRLVYSQGIYVLAALSALLLIVFGGVTDRLIPLFAVGAFLAFTLSQAGMVVHWLRIRAGHSALYIMVNGIGAAATGSTLIVILVAKFAEGAWVMTLLIPMLLAVFGGVRRHYHRVSLEIENPYALNVTNIQPPIVILPMNAWNKMSQKGLRFALKLSPDIFVVQIKTGNKAEDDLARRWRDYVESPTTAAHLPTPQLVIVPSPYRHVFNPLLDYILGMKRQHPDRQIAVLIPELVAKHWYEHLLHNKRAAMLKALLLVRGDEDIVVVNVPWYIELNCYHDTSFTSSGGVMKRALLTTTALVLWAAVAAAQPAAVSHSDGGKILVGCLAQGNDGFVLRTAAPGDERRSGGSSSAKGSTPIGGGSQVTPAVQRETKGSNSAKASTPIGTSSSGASGRRTGGMMTPKGSTAIGGVPAENTYALDHGGLPLASYVGQWVELAGAAPVAAPSAAARTIKVERVRMLSTACRQ
jgi:amino acid transporter